METYFQQPVQWYLSLSEITLADHEELHLAVGAQLFKPELVRALGGVIECTLLSHTAKTNLFYP